MKRILFLISSLALTLCTYSAGLPIDFSKEFKYSSIEVNGVKFLVHSSLADNKKEMNRAAMYVSKILKETERVIPKTVKSFKEKKCKIILYELDFVKGGMEYVREGQSSWDERHNSITDHSIIIAKAFSYSKTGHNGFAYFLHEMCHFHHLDILKLKTKLDYKIKEAYAMAMKNPKYSGVYASSNYLEYFAEISTAYLLESHRTSRFPKGSKELYIHDKNGFNLCKEIWGEKLAAYKPVPTNGAVVEIKNPYVLPARRNPTTPQVTHNPHCRCVRCSAAHATGVFRTPTEDRVTLAKKFLEIVFLINKADIETNDAHARWMYDNALFMLEKFKEEYPTERVDTVNRMINSIKSRIN